MTITISELETPIGKLWIASTEKGLLHIGLSGEEKFKATLKRLQPGAKWVEDDGQNAEILRQLREYFAGKRKSFQLPLDLSGSEFQLKVWRALMEIPYGQTVSYAEVAAKIGRPAAIRAVGQANHCNPIPIIIPCHRVIGADGRLVGFGGGLDMKRRLLELEGITADS